MVSAPGRLQSSQQEAQEEQADAPQERRRSWTKNRWRTILLPMESAPQEIRALDGLRAVAALMVLVFHLLLFVKAYNAPLSQAINSSWYFLANGVWLFFVLSGFHLFLPYARAMLTSRALPSVTNFY